MKYYEIPQNSETTQSKVLLGQALPLKRKDELIYLKSNNVQFSCVRLFATPWIAARQACLSITNSRSSLKLMSIESVMPSSHLILCCPLLLLPPIPPTIRVFSSESTLCMRWPKYWSSALASFLPKNTQGWSPLEWTGWISLQKITLMLRHQSGFTRKQSLSQRWVCKLFWNMTPESRSGGLWRLSQEKKAGQHERKFSSHSSWWAVGNGDSLSVQQHSLWSCRKWLREVSPSVPIASDQGLPHIPWVSGRHPWCLRYPGSKANDPRRCSLHGACYWLSYGRNAGGVDMRKAGTRSAWLGIAFPFSQGNRKSALK